MKRSVPADVIGRPGDDAPRLAYATRIRPEDPFLAELIENDISYARLHRDGIVEARPPDASVAALGRRKRELLGAHGARWQNEFACSGGWILRGFLETAFVDARHADAIIPTLERFPVLHLTIEGSVASLPPLVLEHISRLASLTLRNTTDTDIAALMVRPASSSLRMLSIEAEPGDVSESILDLLCEWNPPMLEHLSVQVEGVRNPCEADISMDWPGLTTDAVISEFGQELEGRHGFRKFLHAVSRFWTFPCPIEVYDILPEIPETFVCRSRILDPHRKR